MSLIKTYLHNLQSQTQMNYTLKQLQDTSQHELIEEQGEDAECGAWIYTQDDDCHRDRMKMAALSYNHNVRRILH